ncbi:hypothetical protein [Streptomyces sp. G45]|uniref:hypothetical protein n=1 Tax=Streptomyces sp. G45 TaxID=3406627 RepID=UPI003C262F3D
MTDPVGSAVDGVAAGAYVRFESPVPLADGGRPGVFFLANSLAREGRLTAEQWAFWRAGNDWFDAAYPTPDAAVYRQAGAVAWFKASATHLIERVPGYLRLLAAHGVECREVWTDDPGRVVYEDAVQVVAVPDGAARG